LDWERLTMSWSPPRKKSNTWSQRSNCFTDAYWDLSGLMRPGSSRLFWPLRLSGIYTEYENCRLSIPARRSALSFSNWYELHSTSFNFRIECMLSRTSISHHVSSTITQNGYFSCHRGICSSLSRKTIFRIEF
jgi:hypothetical protein